ERMRILFAADRRDDVVHPIVRHELAVVLALMIQPPDEQRLGLALDQRIQPSLASGKTVSFAMVRILSCSPFQEL
ncbi:MAG TPA: hypothetical protein VFV78_15050, partial [Vicinamibacterales bacterium]|nr:hypothetical protein [Vicinamibacterales bacterium]